MMISQHLTKGIRKMKKSLKVAGALIIGISAYFYTRKKQETE